MPSGESILLAE